MSSDKPSLFECPADGCGYGPAPRESVIGHYSSKTDGHHPGGMQKVLKLLRESPDTEPERTGPGQSPETEPRQQKSRTPQQNPGSNPGRSGDPTMGSAEPVREPDRQGTRQRGRQQRGAELEQSGEEPVCQRCGGELYDFRQFDSGRYHEVNGTQVFVQGDMQCSACGYWWDWEADK